jgi:hypothetical protein
VFYAHRVLGFIIRPGVLPDGVGSAHHPPQPAGGTGRRFRGRPGARGRGEERRTRRAR